MIYFLFRNYSEEKFLYEPKYNGGYNTECCFEMGKMCVNVEVETPNYSHRIEQEKNDSIKISPVERIDCHKEIVEELKGLITQDEKDVEELDRMDNKLKDFLVHSQKKFPEGQQFFNILAISLEIASDLDEWYSYIFGQNGVFTPQSFVGEDYSHVDAILLTTPVLGIKASEVCIASFLYTNG